MDFKKLLLNLLKIGISVGLLAYLAIQAKNNGVFDTLRSQPKHWGMLAGSVVLCFLAVLVTLVRWFYLIRALGLPIRMQDAVRIGFMSYLFNLSPVGIVGGDVLKMVMLARSYPGRRAEAAATVVFDRVIGLYVLFVVAAVSIVLTRFWECPSPRVSGVAQATLVVTGVGTLAMIVMLVPKLSNGRLSNLLGRLPYGGAMALQLLNAMRLYRKSPRVLLLSFALSVVVHCLITASIFLIADGLYRDVHSLPTHFVIAPLANVTGVLPVNIGPFEYVLDVLYAAVPLADGSRLAPGQGLVVALAYRIVTVLTAAIGVSYYFAGRAELAAAMRSAEENMTKVEMRLTQD